jgi:2-methylisocitrate lyase-like PEP mutase family enzyme
MTKTQRVLAALALTAGASAMAVTGASASGHQGAAPSVGDATSLTQLDKLKELNQLNQLMEIPNHLAPVLGPVSQVAGVLG